MTRLVVTGTGFLGATRRANFGAVTADLLAPTNDGTVNSDTQITVVAVPSVQASGSMVDATVAPPRDMPGRAADQLHLQLDRPTWFRGR